MDLITNPIPVSLRANNSRTFKTNNATIGALTDRIVLRLRRPTTPNPLNWPDTAKVTITIGVVLDGVEYRCVGGSTGGIRTHPKTGAEIGEYSLMFSPTWGWDGTKFIRLGEMAQTSYEAYIQAVSTVDCDLEVLGLSTTESPAPSVPFTNSVAFDAATTATEAGGDGTISVSHSRVGSDNVAAFFGMVNFGSTAGATSTGTYAGSGTGVVEAFDVTSNVGGVEFSHAGYVKAGIASGAQTYQIVCTGTGPLEQNIGAVTFTGVDQTTPNGNAQTTTGTGSPFSVTCTGVNTDDMVVDQLFYLDDSTPTAPTIGADQTQRLARSGTDIYYRVSTQPGSAGGTMSWTNDGLGIYGVFGAVVIKAADTWVPQQNAPEKIWLNQGAVW